MKKILFFLIISTMFWSCKRDDLTPSNSNTTVNGGKLKSFSQGDGKWDVLGYGLDVTRNTLDISSISDAPIFDMTRFEKDYLSRINVSTATEGAFQYYGGATVVDYMHDLSTKKSFELDENNQPKVGAAKIEGANPDGSNAFFSGSFSKNSSDQHTTTYSSTFSYATYEASQRVKKIAFTGDVTTALLMQYLTPEFVSNVATQSADQLVARYGTHVLLDISIGGVLRFNYSGTVQNESDFTKTTSDVKAGLGFAILNKIGININTDKSKEEVTQITTNTRYKQYIARYYGGTNSGQSISIDNNGNTSETINIASWQQSVNVNNATLIDVGKALYLYDFIADPTKKAQVKAAVEKHIKDSQVTLATDPVYQFYNSGSGGNHYTSGDINAVNGYPGWRFDGVDFMAYLGFAPGTVPVYLFYGAGFDHFTTADINATNGANGWSYYGIQFYAYKTQVPGTIPIYLYYNNNAKGGDHFTTANPNIASQFPGWVKYGIAFYAYPKN